MFGLYSSILSLLIIGIFRHGPACDGEGRVTK